MNTIGRIILELFSMWEQYKANQKRIKRDEAIKKARNNPAGAFNDHFGGLSGDAKETDKTDKTNKAEH